jgi:hypothetical protein
MTFFYGEGRFGNQVFQYQALCRLAKPPERILAVGLEDLQRCLELAGPKPVVLARGRLIKGAFKILVVALLLRPLARTLRILNYAHETRCGVSPNDGASGQMTFRPGLLRFLTFIDGGYYQNSSYWPSLFPASLFRIKENLSDIARRYLESTAGPHRVPVFVHVRRGDYLTHTDYGLKDLALPATYYHSAIALLRRQLGPAHLVFVTDDAMWVEENFKDISNKSIASFDADMDFGIMTQCAGGILSNSTFSLAAALMMNNPRSVIAPEYWLGFRAGKWYPPAIRFQHSALSYFAVDGCDRDSIDMTIDSSALAEQASGL